VTTEQVHEMSRRLRVRVIIDGSGWFRDGVYLRFARALDGTIHPEVLRVGADAVADDVLALGDVFDRSTQYNKALRDLRTQRDQLAVLLEAEHAIERASCRRDLDELLKVDELIARRQSMCMGHDTVRVTLLDQEIAFMQHHLSTLVGAVAEVLRAGEQAASADPRRDQ
jgi:hypothetical protein